jgi:hypothetical protein
VAKNYIYIFKKFIYFSDHHIFFISPCTVIAKRRGLRKENMLEFLIEELDLNI